MKYVVVLGDGMADEPLEVLGLSLIHICHLLMTERTFVLKEQDLQLGVRSHLTGLNCILA